MVSNTLIEKKMKGSATQYKGGAFEFTPYGGGRPSMPREAGGRCCAIGVNRTIQQNLMPHLEALPGPLRQWLTS